MSNKHTSNSNISVRVTMTDILATFQTLSLIMTMLQGICYLKDVTTGDLVEIQFCV